MRDLSEPLKAVVAMVAACAVWGLSGLYYKALAHVPPLEVLSHRTVWSMVFFGTILLIQGRAADIMAALRNRRALRLLAVAAAMIAVNWGGFITSIQLGWALEASLGYYIFPLVSVFIGFIAFGERFRRWQAISIALAVIAVLTLAIGLRATPWISLLLAGTFGIYGLVKKRVEMGPVLSVFVETVLLLPLAVFWLLGVHLGDWSQVDRSGAFFGTNWHDTLMLAFSGVLTGTPLVLFSYAAKRLTMSSVGLLQYLNPTLQFMVATFIFAEPVTVWHTLAFPLIWAALAIYSWDNWRAERRRAIKSSTVSTT